MCKSVLRTNLSWLSYWISSWGRKVILSVEIEGDHSPFKSSFWPLGWKSLDIVHFKNMNLFLWDFMRSKNPILRRNKSILCLSAIAWLAVRNVITNSCPVFYISVFTHSIYMQTKLGWLFSWVSLYTIRSGRQLFHILHIIITKVILDCFDTNENFIWLVTSYTIRTGLLI